jgi:hypothetical protein
MPPTGGLPPLVGPDALNPRVVGNPSPCRGGANPLPGAPAGAPPALLPGRRPLTDCAAGGDVAGAARLAPLPAPAEGELVVGRGVVAGVDTLPLRDPAEGEEEGALLPPPPREVAGAVAVGPAGAPPLPRLPGSGTVYRFSLRL